MEAARTASCPSCGAPIAWKLGASHALVCGYCRFAVVRSDRDDLRVVGKVADLVPTAPIFAVGDAGQIAGKAFTVHGRVQLDHGRGPWDEWYVSFADGSWAWLAQAQGAFYLTREHPAPPLPTYEQFEPGSGLTFPDTKHGAFTVRERGESVVVSAEGELPFATTSGMRGRYVDIEGQNDSFGTIDFGDRSEPPKLFLGQKLDRSALSLSSRALGPRPEEKVSVQKLSCPTCGGPIQIFVPGETERCGCPSCGALLDHSRGTLALLQQLEAPRIRPFAPLGSEGDLLGKKRLLIGMMQRHVEIEGEHFAWREYLLYSDDGYTWLVEDNRHYIHVGPVSAAKVSESASSAKYEGKTYQAFSRGEPVVDFVVGEFYWKVQAGDRARTTDYIAPPRMLSVERSDEEINWSEGEYVSKKDLEKAFKLKNVLPDPIGVCPCQPNPHGLRGSAFVFALLALLLMISGFAFEVFADKTVVVDKTIDMPPSEAQIKAGAQRPAAQFLEPFEITKATSTLEIEIESTLDNGYTALSASLLNETTGDVAEVDLLAEYYHGVTDGESWSEGSRDATEYFSGLHAGRYVLRLEPSWDPWGGTSSFAPEVHLRVTEGARSPFCCLGSFVLIALPFVLRAVRKFAFEAKRRENANV